MSREFIIAFCLIAFTIGTILGVMVAGNIYNETLNDLPTEAEVLTACFDGCYNYEHILYIKPLEPSIAYNNCIQQCKARYWE